MPTPEKTHELLKKYQEISKDDNAQYTPLQCAIYEKDKEAVEVLFQFYNEEGTLPYELMRRDGIFGEHCLHIAMKDPELFLMCSKVLQGVDQFEAALAMPDSDGDTVMHQIVEFGRIAVLNALNKDDELRPLLAECIHNVRNRFGDTPQNLVDKFEASNTFMALTTLDDSGECVLKEEHLKVARDNLPEIRAIFEAIEPPRARYSI